MSNSKRHFGLRGIFIVVAGALLTACANNTDSLKKGNNEQSATLPASACSGNAYLQKYGCSMKRIRSAAKSGDPDAQYALGYMYYYGVGTARDPKVAELWIRRAADQGQPLAKKAESLMHNGGGLHHLHHRSNTSRYTGAYGNDNHEDAGEAEAHGPAPYAPTPDVKTLHNTPPPPPTHQPSPTHKPLKQVVPNYGRHPGDSRRKSDAVVKSLEKKSDEQSSSPHSNLHFKDPRLAANASPITATAHARSVISTTEQTMMAVPKTYYTLQLMGGRNLNAIKTFVKQNDLQSQAQIYSATLNHEKWYMLVYGNYPTIADARQAEHQLPESLRVLHPWVKSYRIVQDEIRLRRIVS